MMHVMSRDVLGRGLSKDSLEESQVTICDGLKVCIELCKQVVRVALQNHSGLGFYG